MKPQILLENILILLIGKTFELMNTNNLSVPDDDIITEKKRNLQKNN
jgi:hypothetical protein